MEEGKVTASVKVRKSSAITDTIKFMAYNFCAACAGYIIGNASTNQIPTTSEVKKGFVPPSSIEIKMQDVDLDGRKDETTFIYKDPKTQEQTTYFLKFEEDRSSTSDAITATYTTKPKIVPIEIREGR